MGYGGWDRRRGEVPGSAGRPETFVIFSRRDEPPALILASRRSRRMRACCWAGDSSLSGRGGGVEVSIVKMEFRRGLGRVVVVVIVVGWDGGSTQFGATPSEC